MSPLHRSCASSGSTLKPMTFVLRFANSALSRATVPSSVVHTGVKSFGCEKSTAQLSCFHSWKRTGPSVVWASKSGAMSPSWMDMMVSWEDEMGLALVDAKEARRPGNRDAAPSPRVGRGDEHGLEQHAVAPLDVAKSCLTRERVLRVEVELAARQRGVVAHRDREHAA